MVMPKNNCYSVNRNVLCFLKKFKEIIMKIIVRMLVVGVLLVTGVVQAAFVGAYYNVPAEGGVFGHNSAVTGE